MNLLKFYLQNPKYIIYDFRDWKHKMRMKMLDKFRSIINDYEFNEVLNHKITEPTWATIVSDTHIGILCPVLVVTKVIEKHFGFYGYLRLHIHGIKVNTQNENCVQIDITIHRPGSFIGKSGEDFYAIRNRLEEVFNRRVSINIIEIRKDINEPMPIY